MPSKSPTSAAAHAFVGTALKKAMECGVPVNACAVDAAGNQIAFLRVEGAFLPSGNIARDKAHYAADFGFATGTLRISMSKNPTKIAGIGVSAYPPSRGRSARKLVSAQS